MDLVYQNLSKGINVIRSDKQRVIFSRSSEPVTETYNSELRGKSLVLAMT